jgi:hypothetical protein
MSGGTEKVPIFRVVCVVVSMFPKSDFGGAYLVWVLNKLSKQGRQISVGRQKQTFIKQ